jgi:tripartite ATP-independent transporter DctM subunit
MSDAQIGITAIICLFIAIGLRIPIALSLILISTVGITNILGIGPALGLLKTVPYQFSANWALSSVPTFLVMGYVCHEGKITSGLFRTAKLWLSGLPGGLAIATIFASAGFSALSGSSVACAAAMGRIAVPEMIKHKYSIRLSVGTVAAAGTLGPLIPPSILLILYGIFVQQPIGKLFLGGLAMGIITALAYVIVVFSWAKLIPDAAPRELKKPSFQERMASLRETLPALVLVVLVFGGLFGGVFTASEAGAVGATLSVIIAFAGGGLKLQGLRKALEEAMMTTSVIFLIAIGASLLVRLLALSGANDLISTAIIEFEPSRLQLFLIISVLYLFLGMFLEPVGTMLLTIPILYPVLSSAGIDLLWFGMILIKFLEIGMLTPPVGLNVYVLKSVVGSLCDTWTIFKAVSVFLLADVVVVAIAMMFPDVILYFTTFVK